MKNYWIIILLSLLAIHCSKPIEKTATQRTDAVVKSLIVPNQTIDKAKLSYNKKGGLWTLGGEPFSGYAVSFYPDSTLQQKFGLYEGKKQNEATDWYPDGQLKYLANYHKGQFHGERKSWSSDASHTMVAHLNYYLGKVHGEQKKWYPTGELFKVLNINMGKEEGLQRAYRKNGDLFANYEAREGRIFGLKKSALCFGLENEIVQNGD